MMNQQYQHYQHQMAQMQMNQANYQQQNNQANFAYQQQASIPPQMQYQLRGYTLPVRV